MALEEFKARIAMLLDEMSERPENAHELQERIREQLEGLKGLGMPLPQDLVALERELESELELPPGSDGGEGEEAGDRAGAGVAPEASPAPGAAPARPVPER